MHLIKKISRKVGFYKVVCSSAKSFENDFQHTAAAAWSLLQEALPLMRSAHLQSPFTFYSLLQQSQHNPFYHELAKPMSCSFLFFGFLPNSSSSFLLHRMNYFLLVMYFKLCSMETDSEDNILANTNTIYVIIFY